MCCSGLHQAVANLGEGLTLYEDAAGSRAALPRLGEGRCCDACDGAFEVGVREDDCGVLAAELGQEPNVTTGEGRLQ